MVGTNHKHAPIEVRERLWCPPDTLASRLKSLVQGEIEEAVALSTCNRTEIYTVSSSAAQPVTEVTQALSKWSGIDPPDLLQYVYTLTDEAAARHLIAVASGLDSLAIGEQQIQDQVKQASRIANRAGTGGRFLTELFKHADNAASSIRERSGLTEKVSVSSAVTLMLRKLSTEQKIRTILLVGAGKMISLAAEDLGVLPGIEVLVANRTARKAKELADRMRGRAIGLGDIPGALEQADVVLTCTSSGEYVIGPEELQKAVQRRESIPLIVIDVAVPRNVNPEAKRITGVRVYNIDDLTPFGEQERKELQPKLEEAQRLVEEETQAFYAHLHEYDENDLLKDLMKVAEGIREEELSRALRKLGDVPSRERTILDLLTRRIVNKLLYEPTLRLKAHATSGDGRDYETVIRELFDIGRQADQ